MSRAALRRAGTAVMVVGLTVACGLAVPGTSARFSAQTRNPSGSSSFSAGDWREPEPEEPGLDQIVAAAACAAAPDVAVCDPAAGAADERFVPPWLADAQPAERDASEEPAPESAAGAGGSPQPTPSPSPSRLPAPGERCETPDCVQEAVHVVGVFAQDLESLRRERPEEVPAEAVRTLSDFARDLRELPEPPEEDLPLPEDAIEALDALVEAGLLEAFTPECMANVGQLAALIAARDAAAAESAEPSPSPAPECGAPEQTGEQAGEPAAAEPSPEPSPAAQTEPQPATEPEAAPSGEPSEEPYQDGPGHRVRRG